MGYLSQISPFKELGLYTDGASVVLVCLSLHGFDISAVDSREQKSTNVASLA
jgi:hypothetical protein